jgi:GNAT superfamily N-acetyltransferase
VDELFRTLANLRKHEATLFFKLSVIKLRQAQLADYRAIAKLHADNWKRTYRGILSDNYLDNEVDSDRLNVWRHRLGEPDENQNTTVAILNNEIVGFCCTILNDDSRFGSLVDNLHVTTTMQKSGIGKMLIKDAANVIIRKALTRKMYLWVYEANTNARKAYDCLGGANVETLMKTDTDGTPTRICRYTWDDVAKII